MVILQLPSSNTVNLPILALGLSHHRHLSNLSSSLPSGKFSVSSSQQQSQSPIPLSYPINQSVAAIVFGDGSESRLYPLTKRRSEGAIPIAANYRLIDAVISNCINSNINKIYAITQFNSTSLNSHLSRAYNGIGLGKEGFVEVIAAYQSPEDQGWFQGTADAMRRCLWVLEEYPVTEFLVLPGHHLYKMDYQKLVEAHRSSQADITIATLNSIREPDPCFGVLKVNSQNEVVEYSLRSEKVRSSRKFDDSAYSKYSSMGIYLVNSETMTKLLDNYFPEANDFGTEVIPAAISAGMKIQAYRFDGYWEDIRNISAFYQANMECIKRSNMGYNFSDRDSPLYTMPRYLPPTTIGDAVITDSVIGDGCILNIINKDNVQEGNREANGYIISEGIVVVLQSAVIPDYSIL
ncbi:inactive glucose-1-phosphate adenylyltransferase small subunit 2, chloroplastic isoform X2 [Ricinus communis]|uniref:inactive glucose-1-phosphate adenylyltransferase small subunit 2, chloroplastic isoform X2 n=1 Tax=Ricinus communis TaxID=3988 RepID=UPI00201B1C85|nr:inactive glucose-1-phosphate adenylyltransferase small subunit 2, chloroplastic isoform X2 [Ricinus communis]